MNAILPWKSFYQSNFYLCGLIIYLLSSLMSSAQEPDYQFDGSISRKVLDHYLSRAVTHAGLCSSSADPTTPHLDDDIRMLTSIGAKFIGRSAFVWDMPKDDKAHFQQVKSAAKKIHAKDHDIILQACVFEIVSSDVSKIAIPNWVFEAFKLPVEKRNFQYQNMLYEKGKFHNHWRPNASVPDMSKLETKLWFYYRARRYIDSGIEAIHFGQVKLMDDADPDHKHWIEMLNRVRDHAKQHARRHLVLCDAHCHGIVEDGKLLFDFHSYPLRIRERKDTPQQTFLAKDQADDIIGRSKGGISPSGWKCDSAPYLVELDNYGYSGRGGQSVGGIWVWGYDEISWFAHQDEKYRNSWLRDSHAWIKQHAPHGHLQMPTRRLIAAPINGEIWMYSANQQSEACPHGFNVEGTIKEIWQQESSLK